MVSFHIVPVIVYLIVRVISYTFRFKRGAYSVYLSEGCGKTQLEINDTIPHTRIDMGYRGTQNVPVHSYLYESECCSVSPF